MTKTTIMLASNRLGEIITNYSDMDVMLVDLDAWDATDLAEIETIINSELQRRHDERASRGLLN